MKLILQYVVCALLLSGVTLFFYKRQRRMPSRGNRIFGALLIICFCASVFELAAGLCAPADCLAPEWLRYVFFFSSTICTQVCMPTLCLYLIVYTGRDDMISRLRIGLNYLPYFLVVIATLSSEMWKGGIFYIDESGAVMPGMLHPLIYASWMIYILIGASIVLRGRQMLSRKVRIMVSLFGLVLLLSAVLELLVPGCIVMIFGVSIVLTGLYYFLQTPGEYIDTKINAYNSAALPRLVQEQYGSERPFALLVFTLSSLEQIRRSFGDAVADELLERFARHLREVYPRKNIVLTQRVTFVAIGPIEPGSGDSITYAHEKIRRKWEVDGVDIDMTANIAVMFSEHYSSTTELTNTLYYLLRTKKSWEQDNVFVADEQVKKEYLLSSRLEADIERLLKENRMRVEYEPVCNPDGSISALEALAYPEGDEYAEMSPDLFFETAERTGCIEKYTELLLRKVCGYAIASDMLRRGIKYVCINLSVLLCVGGGDMIKKVVSAFDLPAGFIILKIRESQSMQLENPAVCRALEQLSGYGFTLMLDNFGSGYTDIGRVLGLPVAGVRISGKLLERTARDGRQYALLAGINDISRRLGLYVICSGVDRPEQAKLLDKMGIIYRQGRLYSPENRL